MERLIIDDLLNRLLIEKGMHVNSVYDNTQVIFSYNSNKIEGSALTYDQTYYIHDKNQFFVFDTDIRVIKIDDIIEARNHFKCFDYLLETVKEKLSEKIIKEYHRILKNATSDSYKNWFNVGGYKKIDNTVGGINTTPVAKVENKMKELIKWYEKKETIRLEDIIDFHYRFEKIHPFQDGNGRVGRLIIYKECLKNNIVPSIIYDEYKQLYYRGLKEYKNNKIFLKDVFLYSQEKYSSVLDYFLK